MTFDELVTEVYSLTNRPDLVAETKLAVKAATMKAHQTDFYSKDIYETYVDLGDTASYSFSLDYITLISNFRALSYIRTLDSSLAVAAFLEVISPLEVLDRYGATRLNVAYIAGRVIEMKAATTFSKCILGCYVLPVVTEAGYTSWIAQLYPYAIVFEAARVVFKTIGYAEQSAAYEGLVGEQFNLLRASALPDVGY